MPDISCAIVGDGPERHALKQKADKLGLRIEFPGFVGNVYSYMKSSKVFVFPSRREGFGLVVLEANACGLPVIVMNHPNNASVELIEGNGFVCDDEEEMAERISQLLTDNELREEMSMRALDYAINYDWDILIHQYEEFCINIMNYHCRMDS